MNKKDFSEQLLTTIEQLLSNPKDANFFVKRILGSEPPKCETVDDFAAFFDYSKMSTKELREVQGMEMPDYKKKPTGKYPGKFFEKKINAIGNWILRDNNDVTFALRAYEGWLKQAQEYFDKGKKDYCYYIASNLLCGGISFYEENHEKYGKYTSRIRKLASDSQDLMMLAVQYVGRELREDAFNHLVDLRRKDWAIFDRTSFNIDWSIMEVHCLLNPDD